MESDMSRRVVAEFFGTLWLVLGGCGAAVLAAGFPNLGIGFLGVAFAFGLTVLRWLMPSAIFPVGTSIRRSRSACGARVVAPTSTSFPTSWRRSSALSLPHSYCG